MKKKVGIPRSLLYFEYYTLWETFFEELGVEVVLSDKTNKKILDDGVKICVDEACFPIKIFHGHVINLKDRVDYIFIPRLTSVSKNEYICPKVGGLPDMIKHTIKGLPQIINTEVNLRKSKRSFFKNALEVGSYFSDDKNKIKDACKKALNVYKNLKEEAKYGVLPNELMNKKLITKKHEKNNKLNIAVIGHVYNIYDSYTNMNLLNKLKSYDANILTIEMIDEKIINEESAKLSKKMFWNYGRKAMGSALHLLERNDIDGIIYIMSFGCGVDSFICDLVEKRIRRSSNTPFTVLTIDEHSGEAGMDTRIEAFIDMIRWRCKDEDNISAYG